MIKGAIFDVDGVLLDSMEIWMDAGVRYLRSMDIEPEPNLAETMWTMTLPEGAAYLKEKYELDWSEKEIMQDVLRTVRDFYYYEVQTKPGVKEFLKSLADQKIPMGIATSGDTMQVEKALKRLEIRKYFQGIVTPKEAGAGKTDPAIYRMAAEILGTEPEETVVFEDVLHAIRTANAVGFRTVGVYDRFSEKDQVAIREEAEIYLKDFHSISQIWNKENFTNETEK